MTNPQAIAAGLGGLMKSEEAKGFLEILACRIRRGQASPDGRVTHEIVLRKHGGDGKVARLHVPNKSPRTVEIASQHMIVVNRSLFNM